VVSETRSLPWSAVPRHLHPVAWWLWALSLATAASRTTNPLLLALIVVVAGFVVASRRGDAPWAFAFRFYLIAGVVIVIMRVAFRIVFGGGDTGHILFTLPEVPLPRIAAGIRLFGPVPAEQLLGGLYDGLRLAAMLVCLGAANALANPKRLLRAVPGALYEWGTAVIVAVSVAPQLVDSALRVRRARRLRGRHHSGLRAVRAVAIPVLVDAMDRSLHLAAAMDSRGYGRSAGASARARRLTGTLLIAASIGICVGSYAVLDGSAPRLLGVPMLIAAALVGAVGLYASGRRVRRSVYRPDRWHPPELIVAGCGLATAAIVYASASVDPLELYPALDPLAWPTLAPLPTIAILLAGLPALLTPPPPRASAQGRSGDRGTAVQPRPAPAGDAHAPAQRMPAPARRAPTR
jgi:energy-coupling factor transport system permease protein